MIFSNSPNNEEIIASIQEMLHCPFCSADYMREDIKIMGRIENGNVVSLFCSNCQNSILASLSFGGIKKGDTVKRGRLDMSFQEMIDFMKKGPINDDSVMDFFKLIKNFDGDFKKTFPTRNINNQRRKRL